MSIVPATKPRRIFLTLIALVIGYGVFLLVQDLSRAFWEGLTSQELAEIERANSQSHWFAIGLLGVPAIWWHLADIAHRIEPSSTLARLISSYRLLAAVLGFGLTGAAVVFSGITERFQCRDTGPHLDSEGNQYGFFCTPTPGYGVELLVFLPALLLFLLALARTIQALVPLSNKAK